MSGARAGFDMTVNGFDAGINIFPDAEALAMWQEASDALRRNPVRSTTR
ncbi:MAG: hypothetical protein R2716_01995 [Microthrixaceae bacterium]